jgi:hypothetical protein
MARTRHKSSVTSISWIPSEAVIGSTKIAFESGMAHYDPPPPEKIDDLEALRDADRFRFANVLEGWIEVDEEGKIVAHGVSGGGLMGSTAVKIGPMLRRFEAVGLPDLRPEVEQGDGWVRLRQTAGGRTGVPAPRRVRRRPFVQWQAPLVWTTLALTLHADGRAEGRLEGASRFPRHWAYDADGVLSHKSGLADFKDWYRLSFGRHTPWGDQDSEALVTAVETALERSFSHHIMRGAKKPAIRRGQGRSHHRAPGRVGHRGLPRPRRRPPSRARRTAPGRVRARGRARRARPPRRRRAVLDPGGRHAV